MKQRLHGTKIKKRASTLWHPCLPYRVSPLAVSKSGENTHNKRHPMPHASLTTFRCRAAPSPSSPAMSSSADSSPARGRYQRPRSRSLGSFPSRIARVARASHHASSSSGWRHRIRQAAACGPHADREALLVLRSNWHLPVTGWSEARRLRGDCGDRSVDRHHRSQPCAIASSPFRFVAAR